jgi:hypothetical protein
LAAGNARAGSGPASHENDPGTVLSHTVQNTPGFWTKKKMDEAEPMPLLTPDWPPADEASPVTGGTQASAAPLPPENAQPGQGD